MVLSLKLIPILLFLLWIDQTRACIKTSTYYRSQYRSQTHVFVPEEYRPMRPERSLEASGPLETQDFLASIPTTRLVRMDAPNIQFASEEARWMTKGCRDRLQKLVSLIQSTWPNNDVGLRILDGWIKPPPNILRPTKKLTKRNAPGRFKQTLHMTVPEELMDYGNQNQHPSPPRHQPGNNGLGIKVANSGSRFVMQRPRQNRSTSAELPSETHNLPPYPMSHDQQRYGRDPNIIGFENLRRHFKEYPIMMEEFHYAGRALDMILVDTRISVSSRQNSVYPGKLAQLAYYGALFDWCYFARQGHVHCSVKPDSIITSQWFGCFPGSAQATSPKGTPVSLSDLQIGDSVMTLDPLTFKLYPTKIITFLHRDEHQYSPWIEITFLRDNSNAPSKIRLTANHLIHRWKGERSTVFAEQIRPGDEIACNLDRPENLCRVESTSLVNSSLSETGVYAPLTTSGDMIIDGVFVSCYAHIQNEWLARLATIPLYIKSAIFGQDLVEIHSGVHPYVDVLFKIAQFLMPNQLFTSLL
ncbi:unnamed protein product [Rodentolepis nana]|uniref:HintN domain-containing protein n=1 Tax=Rodentolepis nana TaxID=102285 RepID=A0A158QH09_RODNA|nr:unnamed protein product [Rodentolepis nana]